MSWSWTYLMQNTLYILSFHLESSKCSHDQKFSHQISLCIAGKLRSCGLIPIRGKNFFFSPKHSECFWGPPRSIQLVAGALTSRVGGGGGKVVWTYSLIPGFLLVSRLSRSETTPPYAFVAYRGMTLPSYFFSSQTRHTSRLLEYIALEISGESYKYEVLLFARLKFSVVLACCKVK
jgi:hypothetical protein